MRFASDVREKRMRDIDEDSRETVTLTKNSSILLKDTTNAFFNKDVDEEKQ